MGDFQLWANLAAVLGFLFSLANSIYLFMSSKEHFKIHIFDYDDAGASVRFKVGIDNCSSKPLTITVVTFRKTLCELEPKKIRNNPDDWNFASTPQFPICVPAHSSVSVYWEFVGCSRNSLAPQKLVSFQIQTTSHLVWKTVPLGNESRYLHIRR